MRILALAPVLVLASCRPAQTDVDDTQDSATPEDPRLADILEVAQEELDYLGAPGVTLAILLDGEIILAEGLGSRVPDANEPLEATALMRIGSVTKMLTAAALLRHVDAGDITLEDPISAVLPDFEFARGPSWADEITVEHLLTHQSGLVDWFDTADAGRDAYLETWLTGDFATYAYLMAPAGSFYNYCNPNFSMAALLLEALDDRYYREILDTEIFSPLGMDRTVFKAEEVFADGDYAVGLSTDLTGETTDPVYIQPDSYKNAANRPAGYAWSSVIDLLEFARFLMEGDSQVLSDTLREGMQSERVDTHDYLDLVHYGHALMIARGIFGHQGYYPTTTVSHGGAIWGFSASLFLIPEHDFAIAVLANGDGAYFNSTTAYAAEALLDLPDPIAFPDPEIDTNTFSVYAGTYHDPYNVGDIIVQLEDGQLLLDMPLLDELGYTVSETLTPVSRENFQFTIDGYAYQVTFLDGDEEGTEFFRTRYFVGQRAEQSLGPRTQPDAAQVQAWMARSRHAPSLPFPLVRP